MPGSEVDDQAPAQRIVLRFTGAEPAAVAGALEAAGYGVLEPARAARPQLVA